MNDLISRQDAINACLNGWNKGFDEILTDIRAIQSADAVQIPIKLEKRYPQSRDEDITDAFMRGYLAGRSSADRPTGEWVVHPLASKSEEFADWYVCTACGIGCKRREHGLNNGIPWETVYNYPYCPNCGAKMGGE